MTGLAYDDEAAEHPHTALHGGVLGDADDQYHYEVLIEDDELRAYVNDERNQPLDARRLTGRWIHITPEGDETTYPFRPSADGAYFIGTIPPDVGMILICRIEVLKGAEWVGMEFRFKNPEDEDEEDEEE